MKTPIFISILVGILTSTAHAAVIIATTGGASGIYHDTFGFAFTVGAQPLEIYEFGVHDHLNDGLETANEIALWTNTGTLLASKAFSVGTSAFYEARFRWLPLATPITLSANTTYRLGAFSLFGEYGKDVTIPSSSTTISPDVSFVSGYVHRGTVISFPDDPIGSQLIIRANMRYNVVPEPTTAAMLFSGLSLLRLRRRPAQRDRYQAGRI